MKNLIASLFTLICVMALAGCNKNAEQITTYSFRGEHDYFAISNGSITLSGAEEVFDGGDLAVTQSGVFEEIVSYSTTFYTITDGEQRVILSNSVVDQTGGTVSVEGDLGKGAGAGFIIDNKVEKIDDLKENLWFELKTTDLNGKEEVFRIQLSITE